jgi:hypothetical protein
MIAKELVEITKSVRKIEKEHKRNLELLIYCRQELEKLGWCDDINWEHKKMVKSFEVIMDALHEQEIDDEGEQASLTEEF